MPLSGKFHTFSGYMRNALYGAHGYYTKKVKFQTVGSGTESAKAGDFGTHATKGDGLAFVFAHYFHHVFQQQIKNQTRTANSNAPFIAIELSGGNGELVFRILSIIEHLAHTKAGHWQDLFRVLHYTIYEISPALVQQQTTKNQAYIDAQKLTIKNKSALEMEETAASVIFSNEFFDNQSFDDIKINDDGNFLIKVCIPFIPANWKQKILDAIGSQNTLDDDLRELSQHCTLPSVPGKTPINRTLFSAIEAKYNDANWDVFIKQVTWQTVWAPITEYPTLAADILNAPHVKEFDRNVAHHVSVDTLRMIKRLQQVTCDLQIHVDYAIGIKGGPRETPVLIYPGNCAHNFQPGVDFSTLADFRLMATQLSTRADLFDCHQNYQAIAFYLIIDEARQTLPYLRPKFPNLKADIQKFLYAGEDYKFLCIATQIPIRNLNMLFLGAPQLESYPASPLNPLNMGLSFNRTFIADKSSLSGCLNPPADLYRVHLFIDYHLFEFIDLPQNIVPAAIEQDKKRWETIGKRQYDEWKEKKAENPAQRPPTALNFSSPPRY